MGKKYSTIFFYMLLSAAFLFAIMSGERVVTVISEKTPFMRNPCIIIDAGHGGADGGAVSCSGISESRYNLQIAFRLNDLLNLLGYSTVMIRESDISIHTQGESLAEKKISDLKERVRIVNDTPNAILISIHQNHFQDSRYHGAQMFYQGGEVSQVLAEQLQRDLTTNLDPNNHRRAKKAEGIYLLKHISKPGVLIECGFLSNPMEEMLLRDDIYQKKLCCVIAVTLWQYFSNA